MILRIFRATRWGAVAALSLTLCVGSAQAKKLSLAELAALEWKLEQATNALTGNAAVAARKKALEQLAGIKDPRVVQPLAMALKEDPDADVRRSAAAALGKIKTPESKGLLTLASRADPDAGVRSAASKALSRLPRRMKVAALRLKPRKFKRPGGKVSAAQIKKTLALPSGDARLWAVKQAAKVRFKGREALIKKQASADPSARVRIAAARLVARLAGKRALPALIRAVGDGDPAVRFEAARLLSGYDDPGALVALQKLGLSDADATVRAEARDLLEPSTKVGRRLLRQRISRLRSPNPAQRIAALGELSKFTNWRAMLPMSCTLLSDRSALVRTAAAKTLTDMHDTSVLTALRVAAVIEPDTKQRKVVRGLLKSLRRRVDKLIKELRSSDPNRRLLAARALGQAAYPPGLRPLVAAARDKDPRVRRVVVRGLRNFDSKAAITALRAAGTDSDPQVRKIVDAHFKQRDRLKGWRRFFKNTNRLATKTMDKNPLWRADAAVALGIAGAETSLQSLIQLLRSDKEESVRLAAAWALVLMASEAGEKALRKAAKSDKSQRVRLTARKFLVIGKVSQSDLISQLTADDAASRQDAAEALSLRASGTVLHHLIRAAMCDPADAVRAASLRGLARIGNPLSRTVIKVARARDPSKHVKRVATMMYVLAGGK